MLDDPLIWVRAVHFASTVMATGIVIFGVVVAEPTLKSVGSDLPLSYRRQTAWNFYVSLVLAAVSGIAWLLLLSARIANRPVTQIFTDDTVLILLIETQFGWALLLRLVCAVLVAIFI